MPRSTRIALFCGFKVGRPCTAAACTSARRQQPPPGPTRRPTMADNTIAVEFKNDGVRPHGSGIIPDQSIITSRRVVYIRKRNILIYPSSREVFRMVFSRETFTRYIFATVLIDTHPQSQNNPPLFSHPASDNCPVFTPGTKRRWLRRLELQAAALVDRNSSPVPGLLILV